MKEQFEKISSFIDDFRSAEKYVWTKSFTRKSRDIINLSTEEDVIEMMSTLPWQRLDLLFWRTQEIAHEYRRKGMTEQSEDCYDLMDIIEDTMMVKIIEDPHAPIKLKRRALQYAEDYKKDSWEDAFTPPEVSQ